MNHKEELLRGRRVKPIIVFSWSGAERAVGLRSTG